MLENIFEKKLSIKISLTLADVSNLPTMQTETLWKRTLMKTKSDFFIHLKQYRINEQFHIILHESKHVRIDKQHTLPEKKLKTFLKKTKYCKWYTLKTITKQFKKLIIVLPAGRKNWSKKPKSNKDVETRKRRCPGKNNLFWDILELKRNVGFNFCYKESPVRQKHV